MCMGSGQYLLTIMLLNVCRKTAVTIDNDGRYIRVYIYILGMTHRPADTNLVN